jgi:hypothetical protein
MDTLSILLQKIISGGQTGADLGGLEAAKVLGFKTGGWAPRGFRTEKGPNSDLSTIYNLQEHQSEGYKQRTIKNVQQGDGTVIFARNTMSGGTTLTIKVCQEFQKPFLLNPSDAEEFLRFLHFYEIRTLNVAGNRESVAPGIQGYTRSFIVNAFQ